MYLGEQVLLFPLLDIKSDERVRSFLFFSFFNKHCESIIVEFFKLPKVQIPEKAMAPHSSTLACKIPWTEEPGRRQSMG